MLPLIRLFAVVFFRSRASRAAENLALRQQLGVLKRFVNCTIAARSSAHRCLVACTTPIGARPEHRVPRGNLTSIGIQAIVARPSESTGR
jgi:hypothetical protein